MIELIGWGTLSLFIIGLCVWFITVYIKDNKYYKQQKLKYETFVSKLRIGDTYKCKPCLLPADPFEICYFTKVILCDIKENSYNEKWVKIRHENGKYETMQMTMFYEYFELIKDEK
jgi:hypothetical protein